jgi:hypothetical protein
LAVINQHHTATALGGDRRAHHTGGTRADDSHIKVLHLTRRPL